mmetsp:Transcript_26014/g.40708  ORF Transcript_26014/g.40708 Transcript_26014/m.40708 type:complete len:85 (-) Transcript_26014:132-386(-)
MMTSVIVRMLLTSPAHLLARMGTSSAVAQMAFPSHPAELMMESAIVVMALTSGGMQNSCVQIHVGHNPKQLANILVDNIEPKEV